VKSQAGSVQTLTYDDAKAVADQTNVPDATAVAPETSTFGQLVYQAQNTVGRVKGVTPEYSELHNYTVSQGDWFADDQLQGGANVVVLGRRWRSHCLGTPILSGCRYGSTAAAGAPAVNDLAAKATEAVRTVRSAQGGEPAGLKASRVADIHVLLSAQSIGWYGPMRPAPAVPAEEEEEDASQQSDRLAS